MRIEQGILFFDTEQEESEKIKKDFQGIYVKKHPYAVGYAEIFEITNIQRPIETMYIVDYHTYYNVPNIKSAIEKFKDKVISLVVGNYPQALENGVPQIAVSTELENEFFGSVK